MVNATDNPWDRRTDAVRAAVAAVWREGTELSARLVFRASRRELRRAGIATPDALYDELRQVFWNADEGITLGDHLSVGFGKVDRRRQVRAFAECHTDEPRNVVAKTYEREYGFSAGIAAIWLDLFAEPLDVSIAEWLGVRDVPRDDANTAIGTLSDGKTGVGEAGANDDGSREVTTLGGFLARELHGDICDAGLVRRRFGFEFPGECAEAFEHGVENAGYYEDHGLLFREGDTPNGRLTRLLDAHPSFAKGDVGFEDAVWRHPTFRHALRQTLSNHQVLVYEGDSYISFTRLHDVLGAHMADIESFAPAVSMDVPEGAPFTVGSLRAGNGSSHPLYSLDMPDDFYAGLLDASDLFRSCTLAGSKVFVTGGEGRFAATDLIEWLVARHEGIERDDLPRLLVSELGIACPSPLLTTTVHNSGIYYDDIGDAYYSSKEAWKKEARDGLA